MSDLYTPILSVPFQIPWSLTVTPLCKSPGTPEQPQICLVEWLTSWSLELQCTARDLATQLMSYMRDIQAPRDTDECQYLHICACCSRNWLITDCFAKMCTACLLKPNLTLDLLLYSLTPSDRYQGMLPGVMTETCFFTHHSSVHHLVRIRCTYAHTNMSMTQWSGMPTWYRHCLTYPELQPTYQSMSSSGTQCTCRLYWYHGHWSLPT